MIPGKSIEQMVRGHLERNEHGEEAMWVHDNQAEPKSNQLFLVVITKFVDQVKCESYHVSWLQQSIFKNSCDSFIDKLVK